MQGKIIKGIAGFYYVHDGHSRTYECKAKGIFRNQNKKPLVGDNVEIVVLSEEEGTGNVTGILPRTNQLIRPAVANIDQALVLFASKEPTPNFQLLNRFLIMMEQQGVPCLICFNKTDLVDDAEESALREAFRGTGYPVYPLSTYTGEGFDELREALLGKTTVLAGPSGVGKSSFINQLVPEATMETGEISAKIQRGRHTTRHSELFHFDENSFIMDTPGFSSLWIEMASEDLKLYFPEFEPYWRDCRFQGCAHMSEPDCKVKEALQAGEISRERYEAYQTLYLELKEKEKHKY